MSGMDLDRHIVRLVISHSQPPVILMNIGPPSGVALTEAQ